VGYLILVLLALLMTYSVYVLAKKYKEKAPLWFKAYSLIWFGLIVFMPVLIIMKVGKIFGMSSSIMAWSSLITSVVVFFTVMNTMPKYYGDKDMR